MDHMIGETAGKLWKELKQNGEIALTQIPRVLKESEAQSYEALGWLAREGKLSFRKDGRRTLISLSE